LPFLVVAHVDGTRMMGAVQSLMVSDRRMPGFPRLTVCIRNPGYGIPAGECNTHAQTRCKANPRELSGHELDEIIDEKLTFNGKVLLELLPCWASNR
jgi:hypothetical protein